MGFAVGQQGQQGQPNLGNVGIGFGPAPIEADGPPTNTPYQSLPVPRDANANYGFGSLAIPQRVQMPPGMNTGSIPGGKGLTIAGSMENQPGVMRPSALPLRGRPQAVAPIPQQGQQATPANRFIPQFAPGSSSLPQDFISQYANNIFGQQQNPNVSMGFGMPAPQPGAQGPGSPFESGAQFNQNT